MPERNYAEAVIQKQPDSSNLMPRSRNVPEIFQLKLLYQAKRRLDQIEQDPAEIWATIVPLECLKQQDKPFKSDGSLDGEA